MQEIHTHTRAVAGKSHINQSDNIAFKKNILTKLQCLTYQLLFLQSLQHRDTITKRTIKKNLEIAAGISACSTKIDVLQFDTIFSDWPEKN